MTAAPALLLAAGGVGLGHAVLPDHWVPLAVVGRTQRYPLSKIARLSALAGVAHVLVSVILGAVIVLVGLAFRSTIESAQDTIVGGILIATGLAFIVLEATGLGHQHAHDHGPGGHDHGAGEHHHGAGEDDHGAGEHDHRPGEPDPADGDGHGHAHANPQSRAASLAAVMVPFGAAASPDLTILPVFLAAAAVGPGTAFGSVIVFATVTIGTIVTLTLLAAASGYQVKGDWLDRWGNLLTAIVLIVIGGLIVAGVL
jgi:nickel/cobalt transporter (NicO) family protein